MNAFIIRNPQTTFCNSSVLVVQLSAGNGVRRFVVRGGAIERVAMHSDHSGANMVKC